MKTNRSTLYLFGIALLIGGAFLYRYWGNTGDDSTKLVSTTTIRVGYIPITDCAQMYVALEKGYFAENKLEVQLEKMAGGPKVLEALAGKNLDVGFSNVVSVFLAREKGLDFSLTYGGSVEDSLHAFSSILVGSSSAFSTLADLRGKAIAVNTRKNIVELALGERLQSNGLSLSDVNLVEMPFPNMESVLESGDVQAIAVVEPFVSFALSHGKARRISSLFTAHGDPPRPIAGYCSSLGWLSAHADEALRFQKAMDQASDFIESDRAETLRIVAKYTGLTEEQVSLITLPRLAKAFDAAALQRLGSELTQVGWTHSAGKASGMVWRP